jgi:two-component system phosphate regulon sensor histidine kinase PhoR
VKLTQRLLLGSLVIIGALVALVVFVLDARLRTRIVDESIDALTREASLLAVTWQPGMRPDSFARATGQALRHRVTLIDSSGTVLGDSEFDSLAVRRLENHRTRPEVQAALRSGTGWNRRVSASAGDEELYVAARTPLGIARVSASMRSIQDLFDRARRDILVGASVAILLAVMLAALFSRSVARPVIELRDVARALAAGDLTRRPSLNAPGEVGDLASALHRLAEQLSGRLEALEAEEALLASLTESLNEGAVAIDARQQVVRINDMARRLLGTKEPVPFPVVTLPRDRTLRDAIAGALAGQVSESLEAEVNGRDLALTARPLPGGGAVIALFDLTPMRRLETVRRDFVANVSHELRTPLTVISGFAETLAEDDLPPERRQQFVDTIVASSRRMQRIVDDLLDLSRIESGGWVPNPALSDVRSIAEEVMLGVTERAEAKGIALHDEIARDACQVYADPTALRQVVGNLVDNAVRHTRQGHVTVFTRREPGRIVVGVRDTGTGIPPDHLPRIFERFYRVDPGRSREDGGTGLGLAIVRHMVEAHGGRVRAESQVGRGTTIWAEFPDARSVTTA